jgi:hypothetical protein
MRAAQPDRQLPVQPVRIAGGADQPSASPLLTMAARAPPVGVSGPDALLRTSP